MPKTKTVLGISNVSFGLPAAGREVFNSVFLYHCTQAGLDMAIVNSEMMQRYASIPEEERKLSRRSDLEPGRGPGGGVRGALPRPGAAGNRGGAVGIAVGRPAGAVHIEGSKEGLAEDLDLALQEREPLAIITAR